MLRFHVGHVGGGRGSFRPPAETCRNRLLHVGVIESAGDIQMRTRSAEIPFVELPDVGDGGLLNALLRREHRSIGMVTVENLAKLFERHILWNGFGNRELPLRIVL